MELINYKLYNTHIFFTPNYMFLLNMLYDKYVYLYILFFFEFNGIKYTDLDEFIV